VPQDRPDPQVPKGNGASEVGAGSPVAAQRSSARRGSGIASSICAASSSTWGSIGCA